MLARLRRPLLGLMLTALAVGPACKCSRAAIRTKVPQLDVTPNPIFFQPLPVGKSAVVLVEVRNLGNEDLHFSREPWIVETDNDNQVEYTIPLTLARDCAGTARADATRLTLVPGDCAQIGIRYSPLNDDKDPAQLNLASDDPEHPTFSVPIGLGDPAQLQVCTLTPDGQEARCDSPTDAVPQVEFGLIARGQSALRKVRIKNIGKSRLANLFVYDPAGPSANEFARSANAPIGLEPAKWVDLTVRFSPGGTGPRTAWMQIDSGDPKRPTLSVPLRGIAEGPALCADPSPLDFGTGSVGHVSELQLTLSSCGTVPVQLQQVQFDVLSSPAFSAPSLPAPQTLQPGQKVSFAVRFLPQDANTAQGALLVPNDGQPDEFVPLRGAATIPPSCRLEASVASVSFGQVVRGQAAQRDVTVANRGQVACNLSAVKIVLGGSYFSVLQPPAATIVLRPGDAYQTTVKYAPPASDANNSDSGTLEFDSDDPLKPQLQVALDGQPVVNPACKIKVTPSAGVTGTFFGRTLQFGNVTVGHAKVLPVTFQNVGSANCQIAQFRFVGQLGTSCSAGSCKDYSIIAPNPTGTLAPGQTTQVNVSFKPQDTNQQAFIPEVFLNTHTGDAANTECNFGFPPDQGNGCVQVGMSGQGDISNLAVLPADLDFGLVTLGCRAKQETIALYNTGTSSTIAIKSITLDPVDAPFYITAPPTPFNIAPQAKVNIQATYKPTKVGKETASLRLETNASNTTSQNPYVTVALSGTGTTDKHQRDTFNQAARPTVDLLFIVDNSGSFQDYQAKLSEQGPNFINEALKHNADYHIGVIGNEADHSDTADSYATYKNDTIYPGGLYGRPYVIDSTTADAAGAFTKNIKIGTCCSSDRESGLESAWLSMTPAASQKPPPVGSTGFFRDDARLVMMNISDEVDQSHGTTAFYTDFFRQVKGRYNAGLVSFNSIMGDPGSGCNANSVSAEDGKRYNEVVTGTGGKWWSICSADWSQVAKDLALDAFQGRVQFALTRPADPATVVVQLNGTAQTAGTNYSFDAGTNSVIFKVPPPPAGVVVVDYDALCF